MPHVQDMHERYKDRGAVIIGISYEKADVLEPFLSKNAYTLPVGSDPDKKVIGAYGVRGWPTTYVIGKDGNVAYAGSPYAAEVEIEKALGLESDAKVLLTKWLEAQKGDDKARRAALERLAERGGGAFDLKAWVADNGGAAKEEKPAGAAEIAKLLDRCAAAWKGEATPERQAALDALASAAPAAFDLGGWARRAFGERHPVSAAEMKQMLAAKRYGAAIDALVSRKPVPAVLALAAKDKELRSYAKAKVEATRACAKRGIMAVEWVFSKKPPKDNEGFWREMNVSGMMQKPGGGLAGIIIDGVGVTEEQMPHYVEEKLAATVILGALGSGKEPPLKTLPAEIEKERKSILDPLIQRFAGP